MSNLYGERKQSRLGFLQDGGGVWEGREKERIHSSMLNFSYVCIHSSRPLSFPSWVVTFWVPILICWCFAIIAMTSKEWMVWDCISNQGFVSWDRVSLLADLKLTIWHKFTEIQLPLPPESWTKACTTTPPSQVFFFFFCKESSKLRLGNFCLLRNGVKVFIFIYMALMIHPKGQENVPYSKWLPSSNWN